MARQVARYGWIPDLPDHRDFLFAAAPVILTNLPASVDLRPQCPATVYDQGQLGSCTANAIAGAFEFEEIKQQLPDIFTPSRLFIYYNERVLMGDNYVKQDSGAYLRDGIKVVATQGAPKESLWPYDATATGPGTRFLKKPTKAVYKAATKHTAAQYMRVTRDVNQMKACLAAGYPFVYGFTVYESFESQQVAKTGVVPMPAPGEQVMGGHAVLAVGYDDATQRFLVRNSWGPGWGMKGYFTMPYAYLLDGNLSDDFWTIRMVT